MFSRPFECLVTLFCISLGEKYRYTAGARAAAAAELPLQVQAPPAAASGIAITWD